MWIRHVVVGCVALLAACGSGAGAPDMETAADVSETTLASLPATIVAERGGFVPEGIEYDSTNGRLLTGSLSEGSVFQIHSDGRVTALVTDPELVSSVGIEVDEPGNRILVANADRSVFEGSGRGLAKLGIYDLSSGRRIAMIDLASTIAGAPADLSHFANDVAVAADGSAYVTDTMAGLIYRVGVDHQASVFYDPDLPEPIGFNGIVVHPDGYLLVAAGSALWKVPLGGPDGSSPVTLAEEIPGQDGMIWTQDGSLVIVSNSANRVVALSSSDDWATASVVGEATFGEQATTAALVGEDIYVVHPHFADADPPSVSRQTLR